MILRILFLIGFILFFSTCSKESKSFKEPSIFQTIAPSESGIDFNNAIIENDSMNYFQYGYFYMGGGVSIGDLNGDGLADVYFTGNMVPNKLYLNKGDLKFEDITAIAQTDGGQHWITGTTMVDINADGLLDIYVCVSGKWASTKNLLYINQGNNEAGIPIFREEATAYGLADTGNSIQTTFFDYDKDGDLDAYVANYPTTPFNSMPSDYIRFDKNVTLEQSDHLYRNNGNNTFTDVTEAAGLVNYGLSIGVLASDFNNDGYTDLYVSNDFHSPDRFFLNKGDGTFSNELNEAFKHTSFYGMGVDAMDINNDGLLDLVQSDMASNENFRAKANMAGMDIPSFWKIVEADFNYQYMYNSLQLCNGIQKDGVPFYSDIAKVSGIDKTDWSWATLWLERFIHQ